MIYFPKINTTIVIARDKKNAIQLTKSGECVKNNVVLISIACIFVIRRLSTLAFRHISVHSYLTVNMKYSYYVISDARSHITDIYYEKIFNCASLYETNWCKSWGLWLFTVTKISCIFFSCQWGNYSCFPQLLTENNWISIHQKL